MSRLDMDVDDDYITFSLVLVCVCLVLGVALMFIGWFFGCETTLTIGFLVTATGAVALIVNAFFT